MKPSSELQNPELRSRLDHKRVSKFIGTFHTAIKHFQKYKDAFSRIGARRIRANEGVPRVEIWLGNLVEHLAGIVEAGEGGESTDGDKLAGGVGVEKKACTEHLGVDLLQLLDVGAVVN